MNAGTTGSDSMRVRGVVFDLDGTLFVSSRPREGAQEVVEGRGEGEGR